MILRLARKSKLNRYKPRIAKSVVVDPVKVMMPAGRGPQAFSSTFFTVASVELGNTTTKCIITTTDLNNGKVHLVSKVVRLTGNIREPLPGEEAMCSTLWGKKLSEEAIADFVRDVLLSCIEASRLEVNTGINFVARSTGVSASFGSPEEVGTVIKALAKGCVKAGVDPSKMIAPLSKDDLPERLRKYSKMDAVFFDGAVAGCLPPRTRGEVMANEMEAELSTAGIKVGAKWTDVDCRNPIIAMDFGTTFKGRVVNDELPYAKTIGSMCGLSGAICDAVVQGSNIAFSALEAAEKVKAQSSEDAEEIAHEIHKYIKVEKVPSAATRVGTVPVNAKLAHEQGIILVGCDAGDNGSYLDKLRSIGSKLSKECGREATLSVLDYVSALIVRRVLELLSNEGIINSSYTIGVTGRAGITGLKPFLILKYLDELGLFRENVDKKVVFVEDGLALGANVMARCMHSLGVPHNPLGGNRGMKCIMDLRIQRQRKLKGIEEK
ncbi:MAG: methanogenesis marker 14 protein [Thermoproteota archaeon]